jgi:hypothetical protein
MTSMFSGILKRSSATVINVGAKVWVMDPGIQTVASGIPLPDYVLDAVRSMKGVNYAVPLFSGNGLVKLPTGGYAQTNFSAGTVGYLQVLVANAQYLQAKSAWIDAIAQRFQDTVALYAAMGCAAGLPPRQDVKTIGGQDDVQENTGAR